MRVVRLGLSSLAFATVSLALVVGDTRSAHAEDLVRTKLAYSTAPDATCPNADFFRDLVTSRMGYDPFRDDAATRVTVAITSDAKGRLRGTVTRPASRGSGTSKDTKRELVGREGECADLAQALAVTLAIMLDPFGEEAAKAKAVAAAEVANGGADAQTKPISNTPPSVPPKDPGADTNAMASTELSGPSNVSDGRSPDSLDLDHDHATTSLSPSRGRIEIGAFAVGAAGLLPSTSVGGGARFAFGRGAFSAGIGARYLSTPGDVTASGERVSGSLFSGVIDGCSSFSVVSGCIVASAGSFGARAETVSQPRSRSAFFLDIGARVGARIPLSQRLSLEAFIEGRVPLTKTELYVDGDTIFRSSVVTATLGFGPVVTL